YGAAPYGAAPYPGANIGANTGPGGVPHPVGNTVPPKWQPGVPVSQAVTQRSRRPARRTAAFAVSVAAAAVAVVLVVVVMQPPPNEPVTNPTDSPATRLLGQPSEEPPDETSDDETTTPTEDAAKVDLLTPQGVRTAIAALKPVMGGTKVFRAVIYPEYAMVDAPVKGDEHAIDVFSYRDGQAKLDRHGSTSRDAPVDLMKFDWDVLPALLRKADQDLGVRKPKSRYLIVDTSVDFSGVRETVRVYVSDDHRSGYLVANTRGKVITMYPADK
ncbi:serine/threonine protein kinase, partial [Nonomuraea sp. NN258]|nr:serine/threonine protein kinase [Nonomuraea antri]